jgi:hypothetical protein
MMPLQHLVQQDAVEQPAERSTEQQGADCRTLHDPNSIAASAHLYPNPPLIASRPTRLELLC